MNWWDLIPGVSQVVNKVLDLIPDPNERARTEAALQAAKDSAGMQESLAALQGALEINKIEAANPNLFVSGWRPAAGWLCVVVLGLVALGFLVWPQIATLGGLPFMPEPNETLLGFFVTTFLGLAGLKSTEMWRGVATGQQPASREAAIAAKAAGHPPVTVVRQ